MQKSPEQIAMYRAQQQINQLGVPPNQNPQVYQQVLARQIQQQMANSNSPITSTSPQNAGQMRPTASQQDFPVPGQGSLANADSATLRATYNAHRQSLMQRYPGLVNVPQNMAQVMRQLENAIRLAEAREHAGGARSVVQKPLPRRSSSNAYDVKDADAALELFNPVRKAQKAESSFSAIVRTHSDILPSVSQRWLQRKRTSEVDVGFALARDEHKKKNRRTGLTGLARVLGNRLYEDDGVLLNPGKRSKNDDSQEHSSAGLIENEVKLQSPRVLLDSIRTDIPASKVAQAESQNGDTYTTSHISNAAKSAQAVAECASSQIEACPLCVEEFDISDKNFHPCPCGFQICQFCYNSIKTTKNGLCPACRRPYDERSIEFKGIITGELMHNGLRRSTYE